MDEELTQLEAELSRLRPVAVPAHLRQAIARELSSAARPASRVRAWIALAAAAAIVASVLYFNASSHVPLAADVVAAKPANRDETAPALVTAPAFKPVAARNLLVSSTDEGLVALADGSPARRVRQSYVDTITWQNSATKASLTWTVPREEIKVLPVIYQ